MTTELRLIFLAVGFLIIAYIIWDASRKKNSSNNDNRSRNKKSAPAEELSSVNREIDTQHNSSLNRQNVSSQPLQRKEPDIADELSVQEMDRNLKNELNIEDDLSNIKNFLKPETVITINVMTDIDAEIKGHQLLQELLTLGFKFGEMNIFHRNHHADGQGERWFSLANAFNPGEFKLEQMDKFSTPGLTVFMLLPGPQNPMLAFENMLKAVNHLAEVFDARLEDGSHSVLTRQRIEMYRDEINNYLNQ